MEINAKDADSAKIEYIGRHLMKHCFFEKMGSTVVLFSVLKLKDSLLVWIGSSVDPKLINLCVAMNSPYDNLPIYSQILGSTADDFSLGLASNLTRRLKKLVFVSVNIELENFIFPEIVKRLNEEIKIKPEYF